MASDGLSLKFILLICKVMIFLACLSLAMIAVTAGGLYLPEFCHYLDNRGPQSQKLRCF